MKYIVTNITLDLDEDEKQLPIELARTLRIPPTKFSWKILKKSIDARKERVLFVYSLEVETTLFVRGRNIAFYEEPEPLVVPPSALKERPVVAGFGPAGMFAALILARAGARPIVLERGKAVEERQKDVKALQEKGLFDPESNMCYGEGGAGTFSDGKLNTGVRDSRIDFVLQEFVAHGAKDDILTDALPHILGVIFHLKVKILDYQKANPWGLYDGEKTYPFDQLIFATGGVSTPNLGSDGSLFTTFFQHGYHVLTLLPSLCPIATVEKTKPLLGLRHEAKVTVTADGRLVHEEVGEVLFKDDGLSGIVIFNCEAFICRLQGKPEVELILDLFPEIHLADLTSALVKAEALNPRFFLDAYLQAPLRDYVLKIAGLKQENAKSKNDLFKIAKAMKGLSFHFDHAYGFANSQVTCGGIDLNDVDDAFRSKIEPNVAFVGEVLDIDGLCGGHNLTWCLISALKLVSVL
jgi:predicted Rossmann fold flavoprotein